MGIRDIVSKFTKKKQSEVYSIGGTPQRVYTTRDVFRCDTVQQAIQRCVSELLKYKPTHVRKQALGEEYPVDGALQKLIEKPNQWDTGEDLLEKFYYQYYLHANAYMIPEYYETASGARVYTAFYAIQPCIAEHIEDEAGNSGYYFRFANGYEVLLPANDVIHLKRQYAKNEFFGGDEFGRPDTVALSDTVKLNDELLHGVSQAVRAGYSVQGILRLSSVASKEIQRERYEDFMSKIKAGESGFLVMDKATDFAKIDKDIQTVDESTLQFINNKIIRTFGVSQAILDGDFTSEQLRAFQTVAIDPVIQKLESELNKKLFTDTEYSHGNRIRFYQGELRYVDQTTLSALQLLMEPGAITLNELRVAVGLKPLKDLSTDEDGRPMIMMSKNWGSISSVKDQVTTEAGYTPAQSEDINSDKNTNENEKTGIDSEGIPNDEEV